MDYDAEQVLFCHEGGLKSVAQRKQERVLSDGCLQNTQTFSNQIKSIISNKAEWILGKSQSLEDKSNSKDICIKILHISSLQML